MADKAGATGPLRIGFVTAGLYFDPAAAQNRARFTTLSRRTEGDIFGVAYGAVAPGSRIGNYGLRCLVLRSWFGGYGTVRSFLRAAAYAFFVISSAVKMRVTGGRTYDLLVSSDPFKSGLLAMIAGRILRIPYAIELNGNYAAAMALEDGATGSAYMRAKARLAFAIMPRVLRRASAIKLLYEAQLGEMASPALLRKTHVFHNLVPLDVFHEAQSGERYFLLLGHPWLLKGADIAIRAFRKVSEAHPEFHLRIVGYCPNPEMFERMAAGHPRIHLQPAGVPHSDAIELINRCFALLLPSRTEGMGRVLLEAMAAAKPLVGSRVDGIPRVILHEQNGLLFESGDVDGLAAAMERLMTDEDFARRLGRFAKSDVHARLSPEAYELAYHEFLRKGAAGDARSR